MFRKQIGNLLARLVDGRGDDVGGPLPCQLNYEFTQVGFHRPNLCRLQRPVQIHFFAHHALGLHHLPRSRFLHDVQDNFANLGARGRPVHLAAIAFHAVGKLRKVVIEIFNGVALHLAPQVAQAVEAWNLTNRVQSMREQAQGGGAVGLRQARIGDGFAPSLVDRVAVNVKVRHKRCQVSDDRF